MSEQSNGALVAPQQGGALAAALAEPFPAAAVGWKAQMANGNRALAVAFIDARDVMDRLDRAVGPAGWQDAYTPLPDGSVVCRLSLRVGGEWIAKEDVGGESDQKDEGDRRKSAFSDALKRAAVKWGVGRYLYRLPAQWVDYDPQKKQLVGTPRLPDWAQPRPQPRKAKDAPPPPTDGAELEQRLANFDAACARKGLCAAGDVLRHVGQWGQKMGYPAEVVAWPAEAVEKASAEARAFAERLKQPKARPAAAAV
jgi:hypothetical protein